MELDYQILIKEIYKVTVGNATKPLLFTEVFKIGETAGFDRETVGKLLYYLMANQYIKRVGVNYCALTHKGKMSFWGFRASSRRYTHKIKTIRPN